MPHQCIKCGRVFEEGSSQLLKGCPSCGGSRFFFTKEPLSEDERNQMSSNMDDDIKSTIVELITGGDKGAVDIDGDWATVKPKDVRQAMKKLSDEQKRVVAEQTKVESADSEADEQDIKPAAECVPTPKKKPGHPETIQIRHTGNYEIDLNGLLQEEPIIIQKDGSYTIHLPSAFKSLNVGKKK